jgi:hypothetical protein
MTDALNCGGDSQSLEVGAPVRNMQQYARILSNNYRYSEILKSTQKYAKIIENNLLRRL